MTHIKDGCEQPIKVQFVKGVLAMVDMLADDSDAKKHISEVVDAADEIQYNLSFCSISNGL
jgi:hypothetical protein